MVKARARRVGRQPKPEAEPEPEPELFFPEYIVGKRKRKDGVVEYKIKWKGVGSFLGDLLGSCSFSLIFANAAVAHLLF